MRTVMRVERITVCMRNDPAAYNERLAGKAGSLQVAVRNCSRLHFVRDLWFEVTQQQACIVC